MIKYAKWIGLPHVLGEDPDNGVGADCLVLARKVLELSGQSCPPLNPQWFEMAKEGRWEELEQEWTELMEPIDAPCQFAISMNRNSFTGFNIGVVVDDGVLIVHHRKGVAWIPLSLTRGNFWRVRRAAV